MRCIRVHQSATMVAVMVYCAFYKRVYFSISDYISVVQIDGELKKL